MEVGSSVGAQQNLIRAYEQGCYEHVTLVQHPAKPNQGMLATKQAHNQALCSGLGGFAHFFGIRAGFQG